MSASARAVARALLYDRQMSSDPARTAPRTYSEYVALERASETKHEFVDGEVFAMSGAKKAHNIISANVLTALVRALADGPCLAFGSDMRVKTGNGKGTYPDVSALCGEPLFTDTEEDELLNPSVLVEVLSPTTEAYDRGDKFAHYRTIDSLRTYVLVSVTRIQLDVFERRADGEWAFHAYGAGEAVPLASIGCALVVEEAYRKLGRLG